MHRTRGISPHLLLGMLAAACAPTFETQQQAEGSFSGLLAFEVAGAPWAAAMGGTTEDALTVVSLGDARRCEVDGVDAFSVATNDRGAAIVTWTRDAFGCGVLGFVDPLCQPLMEPVRCVDQPAEVDARVLGGGFEHHMFIRTGSGALWMVDPWNAHAVELGRDVLSWRWANESSIWMVDAGRLVLLDLARDEEHVIADGVSEAIFVTGGGLAYVDGEGLWWLRASSDAPALIAPDACEPREARAGSSVAFLAPCSQRQLAVSALDGSETSVIASDVDAFRADTSPLFYTSGDELFAHDGSQAVRVAAQASLESVRRVSHLGQLSHLFLAGSTLTSFNGTATAPLIEHVASFDVRHDFVAALVDASHGIGRLVVRSESGGAPASVAQGVPLSRYGFASGLEALAFLRDFDGTRGTLEITALNSDDRFVIDTEVSELAEVRSDARPGVAYLIPDGPRAGIWFATPE